LKNQKLKEEKAQKAWEESFNAIKLMQSPRKVWRPKKREEMKELTPFDGGIDFFNSPLIKDGTSLPEAMDMSMVHILLVEFNMEICY
jgi:hypothetical protein